MAAVGVLPLSIDSAPCTCKVSLSSSSAVVASVGICMRKGLYTGPLYKTHQNLELLLISEILFCIALWSTHQDLLQHGSLGLEDSGSSGLGDEEVTKKHSHIKNIYPAGSFEQIANRLFAPNRLHVIILESCQCITLFQHLVISLGQPLAQNSSP